MTRIASLLVAASLLAGTAGIARADVGGNGEDKWDGVAAGFLLFSVVELAPAALLVTDLAVRPQSRTYGAVELGVGASVAALNTYLAVSWWSDPACPGCRSATPYFAGIAAFDLAIAAHGAYLMMRDEPPPQLELGRARGTLVPTMVSDGKASAPGFGLSGTF